MAADAEVKLNITANSESAKAELNGVRALMEKLAEEFGKITARFSEMPTLPEGSVGILETMTAEVDRLRASYASLQTQFLNLQETNADMSTSFLAQVAALRKEVEDALEKCNHLNKLIEEQNSRIDEQTDKIKGLNETIEEQNKRIKELEKGHKDTRRAGEGAYRSLRSVIGSFISQLLRGKIAVKELGTALKGLAYSTVVLGAIQLAMEGISWAWKGIKSLFAESKEEMKAAEEAAKRAQEELEKAQKETERAYDEVRKLKEKLAEKEQAEALKTTLASITAEYVAQRDAVQATFETIQETARLKARERAAEAAKRTGELDMELLGLEERFATGDIGKRDYVVQKADIEKRKREEARNADIDTKEIERDAAAARTKAAKAELENAQDRVTAAEEEAGKYATDDDVKLAEAEYDAYHKKVVKLRTKADKLETDFLNKYFNKDMTLKSDAGFFGASLGSVAERNLDEYERERLAVEAAKRRALEAGEKQTPMRREIQSLKDSAAKGKEASTRLNEERKTAEKLEKDADAAIKAEQNANAALTETLVKNAREGGQDDLMTGKRVDIELAKIARDEKTKAEKKAKKPAKVSGELKDAVKQIIKDAKKAYNTDGDRTDDADVMRAVAELLRDNGSEMGGYKDGLKELLTVCSMLKVKGDSNSAEMARLRTEIKSLKRRTSQQ